MTDFLIKSTLCLFVLLAVYHLALEKEKMHQFNRLYLLFSLVFSFAIPFITIEVIDESATILTHPNAVITGNATMTVIEETTDYTSIILWTIYGMVTSLLLFRFIRNILKISSRIKSNTVVDYKNSKLVLLKEKTLPHTFWNTIFINETDYHNRKIEEELYTHELIHVTQKHTLDILLIETLKTLFWFNPIFIFYKKAIQLNHEFLADEEVVTSYNNVPFYQSLLLSKANENPSYCLTSNLNYSVTKKRLIMMTKTTSQSKAILKKVSLLPLFFGLIFFVCTESVAQEKSISSPKTKTQPDISKDKRRDSYYAGVQVIVKDNKKNILINKIYEKLTLEEKKRYLAFVPSPLQKKSPTEKEFNSWKNENDFAIWLDDKNIPNSELNRYSTKDIAYFAGSIVHKNARTKRHPQLYQFSLYTHNYFDKKLKDSHLKFSEKKIEITVSDRPTKKNNHKKNPFSKNVLKQIPNTETQKKGKAAYGIDATNRLITPSFPGGMEKFYEFIGANYKVPANFKGKGKIYLTFIVEKDGSLSNIKNIRDVGFGTGDEAIRVLKLCPKWIPGKIDGKPVRMEYSLPITIRQDE